MAASMAFWEDPSHGETDIRYAYMHAFFYIPNEIILIPDSERTVYMNEIGEMCVFTCPKQGICAMRTILYTVKDCCRC